MTQIIAIGNAAGSAGKTTTAVSLAALMAETRRVLLIDADAQATATRWSGVDPDQVEVSIGDVLLRDATAAEAIIETESRFSLIPATSSLDGQAKEWERHIGAEQRLRRALAEVSDRFDVILIDLPGQISTMTIAGLLASTAAIAVTRPTLKEVAGVSRFILTVAEVSDAFNHPASVEAVVLCEVPPPNAGHLYRAAADLVRDTWPELVTPEVRRCVRVPDSFAAGQPLPARFPREPVTADYQAVQTWLEDAGILHKH
jgi:chromosome partitioning protein